MERIVLEVDDNIARNWRYASEQKKLQVTATVNNLLKKAFEQKNDADFILFVKEVQNKAAERGLTEDLLNDILNGKD
ncbi:hypothetical protein BDD43_1498 [Mucilaginibacter gracilis]|uniref:Uncharacterized protein n=1 Tax=Mucilaginibacter gracilis TaxID=423350 RepID=A0A495IXX7_9SPHI|nr:hypothetical protein [Mucilaginibacter gracilis]RKR81353.1 hypothetical protein BDD43_1498 [Mucilaginibacter gracilis]